MHFSAPLMHIITCVFCASSCKYTVPCLTRCYPLPSAEERLPGRRGRHSRPVCDRRLPGKRQEDRHLRGLPAGLLRRGQRGVPVSLQGVCLSSACLHGCSYASHTQGYTIWGNQSHQSLTHIFSSHENSLYSVKGAKDFTMSTKKKKIFKVHICRPAVIYFILLVE